VTVGVILLVVGALWLLLSLILIANRRTGLARSNAVVEERRIYDEPPMP